MELEDAVHDPRRELARFRDGEVGDGLATVRRSGRRWRHRGLGGDEDRLFQAVDVAFAGWLEARDRELDGVQARSSVDGIDDPAFARSPVAELPRVGDRAPRGRTARVDSNRDSHSLRAWKIEACLNGSRYGNGRRGGRGRLRWRRRRFRLGGGRLAAPGQETQTGRGSRRRSEREERRFLLRLLLLRLFRRLAWRLGALEHGGGSPDRFGDGDTGRPIRFEYPGSPTSGPTLRDRYMKLRGPRGLEGCVHDFEKVNDSPACRVRGEGGRLRTLRRLPSGRADRARPAPPRADGFGPSPWPGPECRPWPG